MPTSSDLRAVAAVHSTLLATYGSNFLRLFPSDEALATWRHVWGVGLKGLTSEQIERGLAGCVTEHPKFPPTLGEFRALCEGPKVRPEHQIKLPAPRDTKDRSRELAAVREMLAKHMGRAA